MIASFCFFLLLFIGIGLLAVRFSGDTTDDYYLASQSVRPWLAGLSAVATNNSGYMFIGMIGLTYSIGWSSIWLMLGWLCGDLLANLVSFRHIRIASEHKNIHSYAQLLARWHETHHPKVQRLVALLTGIFLTVYAAAQLKAGSKALHAIFDWPMLTGATLGAIIVLFYSWAGGIRASIWTDAAQSIVMLVAMFTLAIVGTQAFGGWDASFAAMQAVSPTYLSWFQDKSLLAALLWVAGWLGGGMAVLGQPHIAVRYMLLDKLHNIGSFRRWYYGWFTIFYAVTILVGLLTRIHLPETAGFDAELALPLLASKLLPGPLVGLVLAGLFAGTISTADSLVLACSSSFGQDLRSRPIPLSTAKITTVIVLAVSFAIAVSGNQTVFRLVLDAWGMLGAAFSPLIICYSTGRVLSQSNAIATILTGPITFVLWSFSPVASSSYAVFPAILAGLTVSWMLSARPQKT